MASGIGELFSGFVQGATTGIQLNQNQQRIKLAEDQFKEQSDLSRETLKMKREELDLTKQQTLDQIQDYKTIAGTAQAVGAAAESENELSGLLEMGKKLGGMPNTVRAPVVDQFALQFKQQYGAELAPVVVATMKKAKPEELTAMFQALEQQVASDPGMQSGTLIKTLSDPAAATQAIMDLTNAGQTLMQESAAAGPGATTTSLQKQRIGRQIEQLNMQLDRIGQAKSQMKSVKGLEQITKMEQTLRTQVLGLEKELRADATEDRDMGGYVEVVDRSTGQVLETKRKTLPPQASSDRKIMTGFNPQTGEILSQNIVVDPDTGRMTQADGSPVPLGFIATNSMTQGTPSELTTRAKGAIETEMVTIDDSLSNLESVVTNFDPKYLQVGPQLKAAIMGGLERFGKDLSPQDQEMVSKFATYKQDAIQVVNEGIKAITGAAMTEGEAKRLMKQFANVEGDSPTQFIAKAKNALAKLKMAKARRQWMMKNGMQFDFKGNGSAPLSIEGFEAVIDKRGAELEADLKAATPGIQQGELDSMVDDQLREEFGL